MITHLTNLIRWEWFKLRRRRIVWILLLGLVVISSIAVWARYAQYEILTNKTVSEGIPTRGEQIIPEGDRPEIDCDLLLAGTLTDFPPGFTETDVYSLQMTDICEESAAQRDKGVRNSLKLFTFPDSIPRTLRWAFLAFVPIMAILTVSVLGSEYTWGTHRIVLTRGVGRWQTQTSRLVLLAIIALVAWILVALAVVATSFITSKLADVGDTGLSNLDFVWDVVRETARTWFAVLPFIALAALVSILTTNSSTGGMFTAIPIAIGYFFAELFIFSSLLNNFDVKALQTIADYTISWNAATWILGSESVKGSGFALSSVLDTGTQPSQIHSFLVLMAYMVILAGLAFWVFQRADVGKYNSG